jgi:tyrosinase
VDSFEDMETDRYTSTSFESPHNNVHNAIGCPNGTMYDLNWSAWDPAFMLHHANVDRLIALWQAIYPNASIFTVVDYAGALYGTPAGNVSADTPLKPFHVPLAADGSNSFDGGVDGFHTSRSVRDIAVLGYTYPELQVQGSGGPNNFSGASSSSGAPLTPDELAEHVRFKVNSLYSSVPTTASNASEARRMRLARRGSSPSSSGPVDLPRAAAAATRKTWSVAISVDRAEVPLPATISCYLGGGGGRGQGQQAGRMSLLGIPTMGVTHSTIPLDKALAAAAAADGGVNLDDADEVALFLNRTLRFEVVKVSSSSFLFVFSFLFFFSL